MGLTVTLKKNVMVAPGLKNTKDQETGVNNQEVQEVYEQLILPLEKKMIRTIWRVVRNQTEAEDTLQEALTTIWKRLDRILRHPNPDALILKICLDTAYDSLRKWNYPATHDLYSLAQLPSPTKPDSIEPLQRQETKVEILDAIAQLPKKQAVAVLMRMVQEESYKDIAQVLGCSEGTVRIHVLRGRKRLSKWLYHLKPLLDLEK
jgi:RNA polymerase sigma-70 factor (ECF subfamily)